MYNLIWNVIVCTFVEKGPLLLTIYLVMCECLPLLKSDFCFPLTINVVMCQCVPILKRDLCIPLPMDVAMCPCIFLC